MNTPNKPVGFEEALKCLIEFQDSIGIAAVRAAHEREVAEARKGSHEYRVEYTRTAREAAFADSMLEAARIAWEYARGIRVAGVNGIANDIHDAIERAAKGEK